MMSAWSVIAVGAALVAAVQGQTTATRTGISIAAGTTATAVPTHTILVGAEGFKFTPNEVKNASVGDIIEFRLYPGNHTVARSDYGTPCLPYEYTGLNRRGFFSGYIGPQVITNDLPKLQVRINDTAPIFFYCTAPGSCFQQHMIGVVNPNATETLDMQMQYALNATTQLAPGDPFPSETLNPTQTPSATSSPTGSVSQTGTAAASAGSKGHGLSSGAIAGIAIGAAAVFVLAGALVFLCGRRGGLDKAYRTSTQTFPPSMVDTKYNPKSPGHDTVSTTPYSIPVINDPYRTNSPYTSSPPPMTPSTHPAYSTYSGGHPNSHSPLMAGTTDGTQGYYPGITPPPAEIQPLPHPPPQRTHTAPVELPTSADPGNSPLPGYKAGRQYSWSQGQETQYRPGSKA